MTQWKSHPTIADLQVSTDGRVRRSSDLRVYAGLKDKDGYLYTKVIRSRVVSYYKNHRMVAATFLGSVDGLEVNHLNGVKHDNRVENLQVCTHSENHIHARKVLGVLIGERANGAKLTTADVRSIRRLRAKGVSSKELAARFGVQHRNIRRIVDRTRWAHVA